MNDSHSSGSNPGQSRHIPPVARPPQRNLPPVVRRPQPSTAAPAPAPAGFPPPGAPLGGPLPVASFVKPAPPVSPPRSSGLGWVIAAVIGIPVALLLMCGLGSYLFISSFFTGKGKTETASNSSDFTKGQNRQSGIASGPANSSFPTTGLPFDDPDVQRKIKEGVERLGKEAETAADQTGANRRRPRPGGIGFNPGIPAEPEKDDYDTNLKRLSSTIEHEQRRGAEWFAKAPLEAEKQAEVSRALNALNHDHVRESALNALKTWGTTENVPMICEILTKEAFRKIECLDLLEKLKDERAIEPIISVFENPFDDGRRAEEMLADWWPQAEPYLVKHLNDKQDRVRERTRRILELRKTKPSALALQAVQDMGSTDRDVRQAASQWLLTAEVEAQIQPQVAEVAATLIDDSNRETRRHAAELLGRFAMTEHADKLLELMDERDRERWQAGLKGLVRLGDVRAAEKIAKNKDIRGEAFRIFRETGSPAEDIVGKTITQIEMKDWGTGKDLCEILGEIGTKKSISLLTTVRQKAATGKVPFVPEAAESAIEKIRQRGK